jgi:hypothetical protein
MRICLLSKTGTSSNWLYEGTHDALKSLGIQVLDINVNRERNEETPHWVSVPTLTPDAHKKPEDEGILEKIRAFRLITSLSFLFEPPFFQRKRKGTERRSGHRGKNHVLDR